MSVPRKVLQKMTLLYNVLFKFWLPYESVMGNWATIRNCKPNMTDKEHLKSQFPPPSPSLLSRFVGLPDYLPPKGPIDWFLGYIELDLNICNCLSSSCFWSSFWKAQLSLKAVQNLEKLDFLEVTFKGDGSTWTFPFVEDSVFIFY